MVVPIGARLLEAAGTPVEVSFAVKVGVSFWVREERVLFTVADETKGWGD